MVKKNHSGIARDWEYGLDFFSTEVAVDLDNKFVIIDNVNEICDMRQKSKFPDGFPDEIVYKTAEIIAVYVENKTLAKI